MQLGRSRGHREDGGQGEVKEREKGEERKGCEMRRQEEKKKKNR